MIEPATCESKAGCDVLRFEVRQLLQHLGCGQAGGEQIQYIRNSNTHPANARPPTTLLGIDGDPLAQIAHHKILAYPPKIDLKDALSFCY
jgi:hypothetical protein